MVDPLVSIIIPVYNGRDVVVDAIRSVLSQTYRNIEVVIVDDASTDSTADLVRRTFTDDRLQLIEHSTNQGAAIARNTAIEHARGSVLAFLDADDIAIPERIATQVVYLRNHEDIGAVGSAVTLFGGGDGVIRPMVDYRDVAASTIFSCEFLMPTLTVRRDLLEGLGTLFRKDYGPNCDWELFGRMVRAFRVANQPEAIVYYRRWPYQMTNRIIDTLDCPATALRAELLEWVGIPHERQDLAAHISMAPCYWPLEIEAGPVSTARAEAWIKQVRKANNQYGKLNALSLERILRECSNVFRERLEATAQVAS